jgi:hypothetical protein
MKKIIADRVAVAGTVITQAATIRRSRVCFTSSMRCILRRPLTKGWDLQVALYRAMLERPTENTLLTDLVRAGARPVTAYHTMLDGTLMVDIEGTGIAGADTATSDISANALQLLADRVKEVGGGTIRLNSTGDLKRFAKDCGITAYALKQSGLVSAFLVPEADDETEVEA